MHEYGYYAKCFFIQYREMYLQGNGDVLDKLTLFCLPSLWTNKIIYLSMYHHRPLARYVKLRVVHAPGMPGKFSPPIGSHTNALEIVV